MSTVPQTAFDDSIPDAPFVGPVRMTEEEFEAWCDEDTRAEWVDGEVVIMAAANYEHVALTTWLVAVLRAFADRKKLGELLGPDFQVRLGNQRRRRVPDLLFVDNSRRNLIGDKYLDGAPDMAIEIVSPDSGARDWREKYAEYEAAGVYEYWVIDPLARHVELYRLGECRRYTRVEAKDGVLRFETLPGFFVPIAWLWSDGRPDVTEAMHALGLF